MKRYKKRDKHLMVISCLNKSIINITKYKINQALVSVFLYYN